MRLKFRKSLKIYALFIINIYVTNKKKLSIITKIQMRQSNLIRKFKSYIYYIYIYYILRKEL